MGKTAGAASGGMQDGLSSKKSGKRGKRMSSRLAHSETFAELLEHEKPIATGKASIAKKALHSIELPGERSSPSLEPRVFEAPCSKLSEQRRQTSRKNGSSSLEAAAVIDDIWTNIDKGKIDLGYAIVGYGWPHRPVLDHDVLITLLINYGYKIDHILAFIDDFNSISEEDIDFPIVMMNSYLHSIYEDVKPLDGSIYKKLGEDQ